MSLFFLESANFDLSWALRFNQYMEIPVNPSKARYCWETPSTMLQISCSNGLATDPAVPQVPLIQAVLEMSQHLRRLRRTSLARLAEPSVEEKTSGYITNIWLDYNNQRLMTTNFSYYNNC